MTGTVDGDSVNAEGLTTIFRELKPGAVDALFDSLAPLRPLFVFRTCQSIFWLVRESQGGAGK